MRNLTPRYVTMIIGIKMKVGIMSNSVHGEKGNTISISVVYEFIFMFEKHDSETVKTQ